MSAGAWLLLAAQAAVPVTPAPFVPPTSASPAPPAASGHPPEGAMHGLIAIYDMICLRTFPDDARLDAAMGRLPGARALTADEVRTYLKDDPGRGWIMDNGTSRIVITIEAPPFHACAVRMPHTDGALDDAMWRRQVASAEERAGGGFQTMAPREVPVGEMKSAVIGDQRRNADGSAEAFYLFRTSPADPALAPTTGVELRMVHQLVAAGAR